MASPFRIGAMFGLPALAIAAVLGALGPQASQAERHGGPATMEMPATDAELFVISAANCAYSRFFEADVAPVYETTALAQRAPLRRLDVMSPHLADIALARPVMVTPTVVLVVKGRESARIEGYPGRENFLALVAAMLRDAGAVDAGAATGGR